jgi:K+-transporting ATPase ATPase A chain
MTNLLPLLVIPTAAVLSWPVSRLLVWALEPTPGSPAHARLARMLARLGGRSLAVDQDWRQYIRALLVFSAVAFATCLAILLLQGYLPLNPDGRGALTWDLAFHTAV